MTRRDRRGNFLKYALVIILTFAACIPAAALLAWSNQ